MSTLYWMHIYVRAYVRVWVWKHCKFCKIARFSWWIENYLSHNRIFFFPTGEKYFPNCQKISAFNYQLKKPCKTHRKPSVHFCSAISLSPTRVVFSASGFLLCNSCNENRFNWKTFSGMEFYKPRGHCTKKALLCGGYQKNLYLCGTFLINTKK